MPAQYRRRHLAYWMDMDRKPRGRMKSLIEGQNRAEAKQEIRRELNTPPPHPWEDEVCDGCPICECVKCGGFMGAIDPDRWDTDVRCMDCGHVEHSNDVP